MDITMAVVVFVVGLLLLFATNYAPGMAKFVTGILGVMAVLVGAFFIFYIPIVG